MNWEWKQSNNQEYLFVEAQDKYSLGLCLGKALKSQILFMRSAIKSTLKNYSLNSSNIEQLNNLVSKYVSYIPEEYMSEIKGMYDGVKSETIEDITYNDILIQSVFLNVVYQFLSKMPSSLTFEGCTNFGAINPNGTVIHGQNYDSDGNMNKANAFVHHKLPNEPEAFLYRVGADLGTACGKNSAGVCLTVSVIDSNLTAEVVTPRGVLVREAMKQEKAAEAIDKIFDKGRCPFAYNLIMSDNNQIISTQSIPTETRKTFVKRTIVQSNQYDYFDWVQYMKKPSYSKKRQIYAENLLNSMYYSSGNLTNEDLLEILRDEPIICRQAPNDGLGTTILFLTRESFGLGNAKGKIGKIPF